MTLLSSPSLQTALVVDQYALHKLTYNTVLQNAGLSTRFTSDMEHAKILFRQIHPKLVLIDTQNDPQQAAGLARFIKQQSTEHFVPIFLITDFQDTPDIKACILAGIDDHIARHQITDVLENKVTSALRIQSLYSQVATLSAQRKREDEIAEQVLCRATKEANDPVEAVRIYRKPAAIFSGDVQLVCFRPNGELHILLGDFTGHGLSAAIGALPVSETFFAMTHKGFDAASIIHSLNLQLYRLLPPDMFLATGIITLSPREHTASFWNGGLPDIIHLQSGQCRTIESSHPPLGILPQLADLYFRHHHFQEDDRLLMLSDGLIEACNPAGEMFGSDRLQRITADVHQSQWLIDQIIRSAVDFQQHMVPDDDISLIEVRGDLLERTQPRPLKHTIMPVNERTDQFSDDEWRWSLKLKGSSLQRVNPVALAVGKLQEIEGHNLHWHQVFTVLSELYKNALEHGILQLDPSLKQQPDGINRYYQARQQALSRLNGHWIRIRLRHQRTETPPGGVIRLQVKHSGQGFDTAPWLISAATPSGQDTPHERGIRTAYQLCSSLKYSRTGRCATASYIYGSSSYG